MVWLPTPARSSKVYLSLVTQNLGRNNVDEIEFVRSLGNNRDAEFIKLRNFDSGS